MKSRLLHIMLLALSLTMFVAANANPVDMRLAREVGAKFISANTAMRVAPENDLHWVATYRTANNDAAFHVFNTPKGFVIVSAEDCATPILGYSEEGHFDTDNVPPQMQDYLQGFVEQIQYGIDNHLAAEATTARQWELVRSTGLITEQRSTTAVAPLLSDTWNQNCYYNNLCPTDSNGPCGHVYAGCVATSMAQIMHFWGYPASGTGSHSYTPDGYPQQTANFGATTYQWNNMPNNLSSSSSSTQVNAVATLIWHCGVAVDMGYGANGSGAYSEDVATALVNYFGYSNELTGIYKSNYSNADWLNQIKSSLDLGRPVHYSGNDGTGQAGHAFVCDGYDSNNYLHFNWGWSGSYNNYFALDALTPGNYNFSSGNFAIINIRPNCITGTTYQVSATASPTNGGTVTGSGVYSCGSGCTLTAVPANGYTFCSWTENGVLVSTEPTYFFTVMSARNLVANFIEDSGDACTLVFSLNDSYGDGWNGNYLTVNYSEGCFSSEQLTIEQGFTATITRPVVNGSHIVLGWITGQWTNECSFTVSYDNGIIIYQGSDLSSDFSYEFDVNCGGTPPQPGDPVYVSTNPTNRNVLIEEFTGRNCGYCPDGHLIANQIVESNPGRVFAINLHSASMGSLSPTTYPNLNTSDASTIMSGFGTNALPTGVVNRSTSTAQSRNEWANLANTQLSQVAECNVGGEVTIDPATRTASITVEVYYTSSSSSVQNYLTVAMLQDNILGSQSGMSSNPSQVVDGQYRHMHILRDIITSPWGDVINPTSQGSLITRTYTYQIPETIGSPNGVEVDMNNVQFLAWVSEQYQGTPTRPVLTACELTNQTPSIPYTITATANPANGGTVNGAGAYQQGQTCTLNATANSGFSFMNWTENGSVVSSSSTYAFEVTGNRNLVANFTDANTLTVYDGTANNAYVPVYGYYTDAYLKSETVYSATQLGGLVGGTITSMRFFASQSAVNWGSANFKVFLKEFGSNTINSFNGTDGATIVYEGPLSIGNGVMDVVFTTPYPYNGGNLLIGVYNMVKGSYVVSTWYGETVSGASVQGYSYDGLDNISPSQQNFVPKTMFFYEGESVQTCTITATASPANGGTVSGSGTYVSGQTCTLIATANEGYTFVNWTKNGDIVSTNATYSFTVNAMGSYVANFEDSGVTPALPLPLIERFDSPVLPDGWYIDNQGDNWSVSSTNNAGGTAYEMRLQWDPQFNGVSRLVSPPIDLTGLSSVGFSFKHALDNYSGTNTIGIATSSDGGTNWHDAWSQGYNSNSSWSVNEVISTADMGHSSVRFCIYFSGNSYNINDWYFDDIQIFALADLDLGLSAIHMADYVGSGSQIISFDVFNSGTSSVTTMQATYELDGESITETFNVTIPSMENATLNFNTPVNLIPGSHQLTISIDLVNGQEDDVVDNNTLSKTISVAIAVTEKIPMIEHFSSSTCGPCVGLNMQMHTFCDNNPGRFTYTKYQMNWPGTGDPYYTTEGGTRRFFYGVNAVPNLLLDGEDFGIAMNQSDFDQQAAKPAMMDIRGSFNVIGNTINVKADIMPYIDANARVYISVNEKVTTGNVGSNGETEFYHVFMKMLPDAQGVSQSFTASTVQHLEYSYDMSSTHVEEMSDLEVAIWVQDYSTKEIFNSRFAYEYTDIHPYPIQNLSLTENNGVLDATWNAPSQGSPIGYRVYLNGQVAFESTTGLSCTFYGAYGYNAVGVQALYANGNNSVTVYSDITFDPGIETYLIQASANPDNGGTVSGAGTYTQDATATLTATPNTGYNFTNWTKNGQEVSTNPTYSFTVTENAAYVANFTENTPPELQVIAQYYPDANDLTSPYVKVSWNGDNSGEAFEAQIGEGTSTNSYFPFYTLYNYSIAENLFLASELTEAGVTTAPMTSLSWYATNAPGYEQQGISIWMANVSDGELTTTSHTVGSMTLVYTGAMTPEIGWNEFVFNEGTFAWDGSSNVLIFCQRNNGEWNSTVHWQAGNVGFTAQAYRYQDSGAYDVTVANTMYTSTTRPNIIMKADGSRANRSVYNIYRADCDGSNSELIASDVTVNYYIDYNWLGLAYGNYKYGVEVFETPVPETFWSNCIGGPIILNWPQNLRADDETIFEDQDLVLMWDPVSTIYNNFINYNIYLDGVKIGETPIGNANYCTYTIPGNTLACNFPNCYIFNVTAVYNEGESSFSNGVCVRVSAVGLETYTINVSAMPAIGGTVSGAGTYDEGSICTLTATANTGYNFINWTKNGTQVSTNPTYSFTVNEAASYVANFEQTTYQITATANPSTGGTVSGAGIYNHGATATLTATANAGYNFVNWTSNGQVVSTSPTYSFTVTETASYVANFELITYQITASANPTNGGTVSGAGSFNYGDTATLTATANAGYNFVNWTSNGQVVSNSPTYSFTVTETASYVANFEQITYQITASANPTNGGTVSGPGSFNYGDTATLTATANPGYNFVNWTSNGQVVSTSPTYSFTVTETANYVANFEQITYQITASANPTNGGTVSGAGSFNYGDTTTLTATVNAGYNFVNWTSNGQVVSTSPTYSFTVTETASYVANFELITYQITASANPTNGGTVSGAGSFNYGETATLTATAYSGYIFLEWTKDGAVVSENATISFTVTESASYVARFIVSAYVTITATASPVNYGTVSGGGSYFTGSTCTLTATPFADYSFRNWTKDGVVVSTSPTYTFRVVEGGQYVANFTDGLIQYNELATGWSWWSTYIEADNLIDQLESSLGTHGQTIKSQNGYVQFMPGYNIWYGSTGFNVNNESFYMVQTNETCDVEIIGTQANPADHPITLATGWNWIGYPNNTHLNFETAFSGITPSDGDQVKSQGHGFASYMASYGIWYGTLADYGIDPGMGLMYKSNNGNSFSFTYPNNRGDEPAAIIGNDSHWSANYHAYPNNMTLTAVVELDDVELTSENYELAAFANGECRGSVRLMHVAPLNRYVAFLTIAGDEDSELRFSLYDAETGTVETECSATLQYETNAVVGNLETPYVVRFRSTTGVDEWASRINVYPNPVARGAWFSLGITADEIGKVRVEIVNTLGAVLSSVTSTKLPASFRAPETSGVYTLCITVEGKGTCYRKLVVR